jgi:hypothetical protein
MLAPIYSVVWAGIGPSILPVIYTSIEVSNVSSTDMCNGYVYNR